MTSFDHIILGSGQATGTLLGGLLPTGESVAIIESHKVGGTCVNTGCTPTKTLVASARVARMVQRAPEYGINAGDLQVDFGQVMARMNKVREAGRTGLQEWFESSDQITLFRGHGRFEGSNEIRVAGELIRGNRIYINTGARPRIPDIAGLEGVSWLDNERILDIETLPEHLIVIGGSYVGLEFAQIFRRLGSRVSIVERGDRLMYREDADVADAVREILENEAVDILLNADVERVAVHGDGGIVVTIAGQESQSELVGSHLLIAVGRIPNSDDLGLDAAGVETDDRGYVRVDDYCRTGVEGVFALGDVNGMGAFTHTSVNDAEIVLDLHRGGTRRLSDRITTYALFVDPPLGRVGLTEKEALQTGRRVLKATRPMSQISRAREMGETQGFAKLLVDGETDQILGAAILGPHGDEVVNMFGAYMYGGGTCREYRRSVLIHPTISELMPWVLDDLVEVSD